MCSMWVVGVELLHRGYGMAFESHFGRVNVDGGVFLVEFASFIRKRVCDFVTADAAVAGDPLEVDEGMLRQNMEEVSCTKGAKVSWFCRGGSEDVKGGFGIRVEANGGT